MDRTLVYPGSIPLDSDLLALNRNAMVAIGYLARAVLGDDPCVDGLTCSPTTPASMSVIVGPGSLCQVSVVDPLAYGSLDADTATPLVKMGINLSPTTFALAPPTTSGFAVNYLLQAAFQESDTDPVVLPYYNAANPAQPFSGPTNSGLAQSTRRMQRVQLQLKAGAAATVGTQTTPPVDNGWVGLYVLTVAYGQTTVTASNIVPYPTAPFLTWKLPNLKPGFGSGTRVFTGSDTFVVPANVTQVEVELWGGGSGSYASATGTAAGGGSGGGYARKRIAGLLPGQVISVTVGGGGAGGTVAGAQPGPGGTSSFGSYVSASGGALNYLANASAPQHGATPAGVGIGGDLNLTGSAGQAGLAGQGGLGGAAPMGGSQNSGTTGVHGTFPGGGASGPGTGADGLTRYDGSSGGAGLVVVRW